MTRLQIMFSTSSLTILREEFAFSFQSLVADVGGVLGLFIGFNFLRVWQLSLVWIRKCFLKFSKNHIEKFQNIFF